MIHPILLGQILNLTPASILDSKGLPRHQYFHANFNFRMAPFTKVPIYLDSYNAKTKTFKIIVLTDRKEFDVGIDYPLVPITELQAQEIVELRNRGKAAVTKLPKPTPVDTERVPGLIRDPLTTTPAVKLEVAAAPLAQPLPPKVKEKRVAPINEEAKRGGRPSMSELILQAIDDNKTMNEIVAIVAEIYPEREEKKVRSLVSCHKSRIKWHLAHPEAKK